MLEPWGAASAVPAELERFCSGAYEYASELNSWITRLTGDARLSYPVFALRCIAGLWEQLATSAARTARDFSEADMATIALIETARSQVGYREGRNNDSKYGRWYGLNHEAWCAMFVSWAFAQAGEPLPAIQGRKGFAKVAEAFRWGRANGRLARAPRVGDVFLISHDGDRGHTGIVISVNNDGTITTIEGNTNIDGSRNGNGVYRRSRKTASINAGFLRINGPVNRSEQWRGPNVFGRAGKGKGRNTNASSTRRRNATRNRRNRSSNVRN
jgi:surface antigen